MQNNKKTIVVTGANKGIGFAVVQHFAKNPQWHAVMAVRNTKLGQQALDKIKAEIPEADVVVEELDVSNFESIDKFLQRFTASNQRIDVLVNNAAILQPVWNEQSLKTTFQTNLYGTIYLTQKSIPLIPQNGKIITVSSLLAQYPNTITSPQTVKKWSRQDLTKEDFNALLKEFEDSVKDGTVVEKGYFVNNIVGFYSASKLALSTHVRIFAQSPQVLAKNIQVYNLHPGYVRTEMNGNKGTLSLEEGIDTIVYLVELPFEFNEKFQGKLFHNREIITLEAEKALKLE